MTTAAERRIEIQTRAWLRLDDITLASLIKRTDPCTDDEHTLIRALYRHHRHPHMFWKVLR